jgi:hypothetical protein
MRKAMTIWTIALGLVGLAAAGCNDRPDMPRLTWHEKPISTLTVNTEDPAEVAAATKAQETHDLYAAHLDRLRSFYDDIGSVQKRQWAEKEIRNLAEAHQLTFVGVPATPTPPPTEAENAQERDLVENVISACYDYRQAVDAFAQVYETNGDAFNANLVHTLQARFHPEETFMYLLYIGLPPENLQPLEQIAAADDQFFRAENLYYEGKKIPIAGNYERERQSLTLFRNMIRRYPKSTKISVAAYFVARLYKDFFREPYLAVLWFERARTWDPHVAKPVRFEEAKIYDYEFRNEEKALELYRASLKREAAWEDHVRYAKQRIKELTEGY